MMVQSKPQHKACPRRTEFTAVKLAADIKKKKKEERKDWIEQPVGLSPTELRPSCWDQF